MRTYNKPEIEISNFEVEDVITTSGTIAVTADIDGASTAFKESWKEPSEETNLPW